MSEEMPADSQGSMIVFGAKSIRRQWVDDRWFFSVVDIVEALTDSTAPAKYWTAMKQRELDSSGIQLSTFCRQLKLKSADGSGGDEGEGPIELRVRAARDRSEADSRGVSASRDQHRR